MPLGSFRIYDVHQHFFTNAHVERFIHAREFPARYDPFRLEADIHHDLIGGSLYHHALNHVAAPHSANGTLDLSQEGLHRHRVCCRW